MKLTYFGHACFQVVANGKTILFDPFIQPNPIAAGKVKISDVQPDAILISHGHADHLADAVEIAKASDALVVANWEIIQWLESKGISNTHPMNHGGARSFPFGRVKMTNAIHSSSFFDGTYAGNPGGFIVETSDGSFYYSGDTALTMDMQLIGQAHNLRFAVLPVGDNFTMGPADALKAAEFVAVEDVVGVHFNTFPPIQIDCESAETLFANAGKKLHLLDIKQSVEF